MVIYQTPFDPATRQCTGVSVMTSHNSLTSVMFSRGDQPLHAGKRTLVYPGVCFTDWVLNVDAGVKGRAHCAQNHTSAAAS